jgi:hypothetical protein
MPRSRVIYIFKRSFSLEDLLVDAGGTAEKYDYRRYRYEPSYKRINGFFRTATRVESASSREVIVIRP